MACVINDLISTLLAIEPPVDYWLEHPNKNSEGHEFDPHVKPRIFCELSGVRFLLLPDCFFFCYIYVVVQFYPWFEFYFLLFLGVVMYENEFERKETKT